MSSFALRRAVFLPRTAYATRAFTTSFAAQKSATEAVKDGAKKVDRTVSDNVVLPGLDAAGTLYPLCLLAKEYIY